MVRPNISEKVPSINRSMNILTRRALHILFSLNILCRPTVSCASDTGPLYISILYGESVDSIGLYYSTFVNLFKSLV